MDRDFLIDLFSGFGPVTIRRMFSGFGISADGTNFALSLRSGLYLRADGGLYAAKRNGRNRVICEADPEYAAETQSAVA